MKSRTLLSLSAAALLVALGAATANADLAGKAQIALTSSAAGNNTYTINVQNTGSSDIGTFWFAWTPPGAPTEYDFLPTQPSAATQPPGWIGFISPGDPGTSIEYFNNTGSAIPSGGSASFTFTTTDTPADLQGTDFGFPITASFIYQGMPEVGDFAEVDPVFTVPEPASIGILAVAGLALLGRRRRS